MPMSDSRTDVPTLAAELPVLPIRDAVVLPMTVAPLAVTRLRAIEAVHRALAGDRMLLRGPIRDQSDLEQ